MRLINLTRHAITIIGNNGDSITYNPDAKLKPLRLEERAEFVRWCNGTPLMRVHYHVNRDHLPPQRDGVYYIVSGIVAEASRCPDFVVPYRYVRDASGTLIGCRALRTASSIQIY